MPLNLRLKSDRAMPIDVRGLSDGISQGMSASQIGGLMVWAGKRSLPVGECFDVYSDAGVGGDVIFSGDLSNVHSIGRELSGGSIVIKSTKVGRHVGTTMSGGKIFVQGDVGNFLGAEMTGGTICVAGDAGDFVGAALEGAKYGMNRGEIFIEGDAGVGLGKRMRRGMIVVGGEVGQLAAWNMLAGTIVVMGGASEKTAAAIKRGTVVLAGDNGEGGTANEDSSVIETGGGVLDAAFVGDGSGGSSEGVWEPQIVRFLTTWLIKRCPESIAKSLEQNLLGQSFVKYNGGELNQNRAEIFVRLPNVSAS